jgi:hypothetical protein
MFGFIALDKQKLHSIQFVAISAAAWYFPIFKSTCGLKNTT